MSDLLPIPLNDEIKAAITGVLNYKVWSDEPEINIKVMRKILEDIEAAMLFAERQLATGHKYVLHSPLTGLLDKEGK